MSEALKNKALWYDRDGVHINAHGGGILAHGGWYYWYGEHKIGGEAGNRAWVGMGVYRSKDLRTWENRGIAFDIRDGRYASRGMAPGRCILERPKVLFNGKTGKFVMFFHCETGENYQAAEVGIALAAGPEGPFELLKTERPSRGRWAENTPEEMREPERIARTRAAGRIENCRNGLIGELSVLGADLEVGQQSRDMTVYGEPDGRAYLIHSSENNSTLHIVELDETYTKLDGRYWRVFPGRWMEAPVIWKRGGLYYMICSDCTGWAPNAARGAVAERMEGPWRELGNPAEGEGRETTFGCQGNYALELGERTIFMADEWCPGDAIDGRYMWLEVEDGPKLRESENAPGA